MKRVLFRGPVWKKIIAISLFSALPVVAALFFHETIHREHIVSAAKREVQIALGSFSRTQEAITASTRTLLNTVASMPEVQRGSPSGAKQILQTLIKANPLFTNIILVDLKGNVIAMGKGEDKGFNFADRKQFRDAVRTGRFSFGEYVIGKATGKAILPFGMPVKGPDGVIRSVIIVGLNLSHFKKVFLESSFTTNMFFGISDHNGIRLFRVPSPEGASIGTPIRQPVFDAARTGQPGVIMAMASDGRERYIAYEPLRIRPVDPPYMYMFLGADSESATYLASSTMKNSMVISMGAVMLVLVLSWWLAKKSLVEGMRRLTFVTRTYGSEGQRIESDIDYRDGEIGELAQSFDEMTRVLEQREHSLREAKDIAEMANRTKDEFIANVSHEVRTPLSGVAGMLQLLRDTPMNPEQKEYVQTAIGSSKGLQRVIDDLLDFSRIQAGKLSLLNEPFDVSRLIHDCLSVYEPMAREKGLAVFRHLDENTLGWYLGDSVRIRQVLFNVIGNAIKYTQEGFITIEVYTLPYPKEGWRRLFFVIEDTGIGIENSDLEGIFQTFRQVDGSLSRKYKGMGLGLPIVKKLVNLMGGSCVVESEPGRGTTFLFCVLVEECEAPRIVEETVSDGVDASFRILLVEDERVNRLTAQRILEKMGHEVLCAENGQQCLEMAAQAPFDLILMDIQMPVMDGLEATRRIRAGEVGIDAMIPIVALSAHASRMHMEEALAAGIDEYITKPFDKDKLAEVLRSIRRKQE